MPVGYSFSNPSDIFTGLVQSNASLRIGIAAYKSYVDKKLSEFNELVDALLSDEQDKFSGTELVTIPVIQNGKNYVCAATFTSLHQAINGVRDVATAFKVNAKTGNLDDNALVITTETVNQFIVEKVGNLQSQSVLFGAAMKSDLSKQFSAADIVAEMQLRGFTTSNYLQNVVTSLSTGMTWGDALKVIANNTSTPSYSDQDPFWSFDADLYSDTSSIVLAARSIVGTVTGFFSELDFDIRKLDEFFHRLIQGIGDMMAWIITMLAGDVMSDYVVNDAFTIEAIDIPIASVKIDIGTINSNSILNNLKTSYLADASLGGCCFGNIWTDSSSVTPKAQLVGYLPDYSRLITNNKIAELINDKTSVTIPWSRGFIYLYRDGSLLTVYYFLGDFSNVNRSTAWDANASGVLTIRDQAPFSKSYSAQKFSNNNEFVTWFKSMFTEEQQDSFTIYADNNFVGCGTVAGSTSSTGTESRLPMVYNLSNINGPKTLISACSPFYYDNVSDTISGRLFIEAIKLLDIYTSDAVTGGCVTTSNFWSDYSVEDADFQKEIFLPYERNAIPSFKYHCQPDEERTSEMLTLVKNVAIAAAAAAVAVGTVKARKSLRVKAYSAKTEALDAWRAIDSSDDKSLAINNALKKQRKANLLSKVSGLLSGPTLESQLFNSLTDLANPDSTNLNFEQIIRIITG